MKPKEILLQEIEDLPEEMIREAIDFVRYLKQRKYKFGATTLAGESTLKKDWLSHKEDEAWQDL